MLVSVLKIKQPNAEKEKVIHTEITYVYLVLFAKMAHFLSGSNIVNVKTYIIYRYKYTLRASVHKKHSAHIFG